MGHIINPISYRLYNIRYWNNTWFTSNHINYSFLSRKDYQITKLITKVFYMLFKSTNAAFMIPNVKVIRRFENTDIYIYLHDCYADIQASKPYPKWRIRQIKRICDSLRNRLAITSEFIETRRLKADNMIKFQNSVTDLIAVKKTITKKLACFIYTIFNRYSIKKAYWLDVKLVIAFYLKKLNNKVSNENIHIVSVNKNYITADMVSEFFSIKLDQRYTIWELLRTINFLFKNQMARKTVSGYKIVCSGRFSRKQRATYSWKIFRSLAPASVKSNLDYSYRTIALKYSACTIKVYVRNRRNHRQEIVYIA